MKKNFRGAVLWSVAALLAGAVTVTTVDKLLIEPLTVNSVSELAGKYIEFRKQMGPIVPPSVFYQDDRRSSHSSRISCAIL